MSRECRVLLIMLVVVVLAYSFTTIQMFPGGLHAKTFPVYHTV